jgi:NhaP-type Na+/H+ or K+/H+ antiporter
MLKSSSDPTAPLRDIRGYGGLGTDILPDRRSITLALTMTFPFALAVWALHLTIHWMSGLSPAAPARLRSITLPTDPVTMSSLPRN